LNFFLRYFYVLGSTFSIWKISDLKAGMSTVTIFLFGRSHADLWKTDIGFVVGILNPKGEAKLTNDNKILTNQVVKQKLCYTYYKIGKL